MNSLNNDINTSPSREPGIDIVKALATFFVVAIHFYLSCGYYNSFIASNKMYAMTVGRWLFITAVPLFLISTGYLKAEKAATSKHFKSLIPIGITYVVLCCIRMIVENSAYGKIHTLSSALKGLLNYQCAWYVGMYMALMLICPFLNKMYKACTDMEKRLLIMLLCIITLGYPVIPYVFPSFFMSLYPVTYYLIGVYIREFRPKVNRLILTAVIVCCTAFNVIYTVICSKGLTFNAGFINICDNGQNAFTVSAAAVSLFLLLYDVKISLPWLNTVIRSISGCSLEIYLLQAAFNAYIYTYLGRRFHTAEEYFFVFFVSVPVSFVLSWASAVIYKKLYGLIYSLIKK